MPVCSHNAGNYIKLFSDSQSVLYNTYTILTLNVTFSEAVLIRKSGMLSLFHPQVFDRQTDRYILFIFANCQTVSHPKGSA